MKIKKTSYVYLFLLLIFLSLFTVSGFAQFGGEARNVEVNGFLLGHFSGSLLDKSTLDDESLEKDSDFLVGEERLRLDISAWSEEIEASARVKIDFANNEITDEAAVDVREAFVDYTLANFDFRIGRQIVTWGVGDLLFINDVYPKDWVSFFTGRPLEYLKLGVDACRARYSSEILNGEFLVMPTFRPDTVPDSERFYFFNPYVALKDAEQLPNSTYENLELAARAYRRFGDFDVSAYYYKGFWRSPSVKLDNEMMPAEAIKFYPELFVHGLSAQSSLFGGIVNLETGYYYSREDKEGDDPLLPNSQMRYLTGYQRQLWEDASFGMQYYDEVTEKHETLLENLPASAPTPKAHRDTVTIRLEQMLQHQTLILKLFTFYSPSDNDSLIQPAVTYKFADNLSGTLGGNIFGGEHDDENKDPTFLAQFDKSDNLYLSLRYDF